MEAGVSTRVADRILGVTTPALFTAGLALGAWFSVWAIYAWTARSVVLIAEHAALTFLALGLPVAFVAGYERWQVKHRLYSAVPGGSTRIANGACRLFGVLLLLAGIVLFLLFTLLALSAWNAGEAAGATYFGVVAVALLAEPVIFLIYYDRWQKRHGLD